MQTPPLLVHTGHNRCGDEKDQIEDGYGGDDYVVHEIPTECDAPPKVAAIRTDDFKPTGHFPERCPPIPQHHNFVKHTKNECSHHKGAAEHSWLATRLSQQVW